MHGYIAPVSGNRPSILIVGGGSRIAGSLAPHLGDRGRWIVRRENRYVHQHRVADYGDIPVSAFDGIECVVNCVGISEGTQAELDHVNIELSARLANVAKMAGVARLIHISSFSVHGGAKHIDRTTPTAPVTDYGRSKLAAEKKLSAIADDGFGVTLLRLPLIYDAGSFDRMGKLGRLLALWRRTRIWPVPSGDIARAMIGVDLSAEVVARLIEQRRSGIVFAADPQPFTYTGTLGARRQDALYRLPVPRRAAAAVVRIAPGIGARLFADSRLAEEDNLAVEYGLASRLYHDIAAAHPG